MGWPVRARLATLCVALLGIQVAVLAAFYGGPVEPGASRWWAYTPALLGAVLMGVVAARRWNVAILGVGVLFAFLQALMSAVGHWGACAAGLTGDWCSPGGVAILAILSFVVYLIVCIVAYGVFARLFPSR